MPGGFQLTISIPEFSSPLAALWWLFTHGGFVAVVIAIGYGIWWLYLDYIQSRYLARQQYVMLAVDVPKLNEQTPKAVEHIFSHFHGIHKQPNKRELYVEGFVQPTITVELVSIGGYIQFVIRTPIEQRDLVESAIYAQYPDAEISEVEDYAYRYDPKFPNDEFDLWASELQMTNKDPYPIKTYPLWEHSLTQTFLDPMASMLEMMGRLQDGEEIWFQWILKPTLDSRWRDKGMDIINKLIGAKVKIKKGALDSLVEAPGNVLLGTYNTLTRTLFEPVEGNARKDDNGLPSLMQHLPPHVKNQVEAIGIKISKLAFETKARVVYVGRQDVFNKSRVSSIFGSLKQFATLDMNGFKPDKVMKTQRSYFRVPQRVAALKRKLLLGYRTRSNWTGRTTFMLNTEELASLWHFPVVTVKAPQVKKTDAKRGEPPVTLPTGEVAERVERPVAAPAGPRGGAPTNLPTRP